MKLTFISDTHSEHEQLNLGVGDILFHCGDFTKRGEIKELERFAEYMGKQKFRYKVFIAGNHDFCFENENKTQAEKLLEENGIIYLNDSMIEIEGIKIWGSPVQPWYFDWAFNRHRGEEIKKHWDLIPENIDILLIHGPPHGIMDRTHKGEIVGCEELLLALNRIKPKILAFGHIHECYGVQEYNHIKMINACLVDLKHNVVNSPISINWFQHTFS